MTTTLYGEQSTLIHRLNPLTKLVALLAIIVIAFATPYWWVSLLLVLVVILPAAAIARCGRRLLWVSLIMLLPIVFALFLVQGLTFPGGSTALFDVWIFTVTSEGLLFALLVSSRITALVLASVLFVLTTHPGVLMTDLTERGMSPKFAYLVSSTLQLVPAFKDRADSILLAQQSRGLAISGNPLKRIKLMMPLVSPLVLGMFTDVEERSTAMEARAFGSTAKRTTLIPVPDSTAQRVARWGMLVLALIAIAIPIAMAIL
ncbi:MAG TPA: energy-coupling factor transporter transmembrane component T [Terrimesophilobacter sp.]|nr:energy-coupling factor transporter transmembrane component T [Terrimesophilobacter sp.]